MVGAVILNANVKVRFPCIINQARSPLPVKPMPVRVPIKPHPHWVSLQAEVEAHLRKTIPMKEPLEVFEPMHHVVWAAPTTTVPALCLAACELVGGHRHDAMAAASALLLNLSNTHAHENLSAHTDRPEPGAKPKPRYGANIQLLTGDGIVPFGFELLARSSDGPGHGHSERILRVIIEISRAVGSSGLIDSQYMKKTWLEAPSDGVDLRHVESIKRVVEKKEGGLHACGAACGAVLGGGSEEEIERLRNFGFYVGMMRGMVNWGFVNEDVDEVRTFALKELEFFKDRDVHVLSSFLNF